MNFPYYYVWKNMISSFFTGKRTFLSGYQPSVPLTYLYAKDKSFQFHGNKWM